MQWVCPMLFSSIHPELRQQPPTLKFHSPVLGQQSLTLKFHSLELRKRTLTYKVQFYRKSFRQQPLTRKFHFQKLEKKNISSSNSFKMFVEQIIWRWSSILYNCTITNEETSPSTSFFFFFANDYTQMLATQTFYGSCFLMFYAIKHYFMLT